MSFLVSASSLACLVSVVDVHWPLGAAAFVVVGAATFRVSEAGTIGAAFFAAGWPLPLPSRVAASTSTASIEIAAPAPSVEVAAAATALGLRHAAAPSAAAAALDGLRQAAEEVHRFACPEGWVCVGRR